ncbi:hypothetical protein [Novosphingobium resinovorum]|uniref:hypothetical protein n=1 Tax=Novosphingobium resinovorum TaxID=158500 RepID=UPI002ED181E8|nr:hypothetical protein [Novosphingobium resinovorum]
MKMVLAVAMLTAAIANPAAAKNVEVRRIQIDGETFRIAIFSGTEVKVTTKKFPTPFGDHRTTERLGRIQRAVREATGCELVNDLWIEIWRQGRLDCPPEGLKPWPQNAK